MKTRLLLVPLFTLSLFVNSQTTSIPDDIFENYLETRNSSGFPDTYPNTMGDGIIGNNLVETAKINTVTSLVIPNLGISYLTGIEDFTALQVLTCFNNNLTSLDVSSNTNLLSLACSDNNLTSLTIGTQGGLTQIYAANNDISSIDVTQLPSLTVLDVTNNTNLSSLDVSQNYVIERLAASNCPIGSINVKGSTWQIYLRYVTLDNCSLSEIDLSNHIFLQQLDVSDNMLTSLDLTNATSLFERLICNNNNLTTLNVKNGVNNLITNANFNALNNNLTCITVDDENYSTTNWSNIDGGVSFSTDCSLGLENNIKESFIAYPNPVNEMLYIKAYTLGSYQLFDINGKQLNKGELNIGNNSIPISQLRNSMFIVRIENDFGLVTKKIIKH